jgi:hypothetical protein
MPFSVGSPNGQTSFDRSDLENPMGERSKDALKVNFDQKLKLEFHGYFGFW